MNKPTSPRFVDALLEQGQRADQSSYTLKQEIQSMMICRLRTTQRVFLYILSLVLAIAGFGVGSLVVTETLPALAYAGLLLCVVFAVVWAWKVFSLARAGEMHRQKDSRAIANMVWVFTVAMAVLMFMAAGFKDDLSSRNLILITGQALFFLVTAATCFIVQRLEQSNLAIRERMLQIELRVANSGQRDDAASPQD